MWKSGDWILDGASSHMSAKTRDYMEKHQFNIHSSSSLLLQPCSLWLFLISKKNLSGIKFDSIEKIREVLAAGLKQKFNADKCKVIHFGQHKYRMGRHAPAGVCWCRSTSNPSHSAARLPRSLTPSRVGCQDPSRTGTSWCGSGYTKPTQAPIWSMRRCAGLVPLDTGGHQSTIGCREESSRNNIWPTGSVLPGKASRAGPDVAGGLEGKRWHNPNLENPARIRQCLRIYLVYQAEQYCSQRQKTRLFSVHTDAEPGSGGTSSATVWYDGEIASFLMSRALTPLMLLKTAMTSGSKVTRAPQL